MKLVYISPLRYPSEKAGSIFSFKSCEAFAKKGLSVELWVPLRRNVLSNKDPFVYFGVPQTFKVRHFFALDFIGLLPGSFYLLSYSFAISVFFYSLYLKLSGKVSQYVFYSHEQFALFLLTFVSSKTFYEIHDFPGNQKAQGIFFRRITGTVSTNYWKTEELKKRFNISANNIFTVPNAVDLTYFSTHVSKMDARKKLHLGETDYFVGYVGALKTMDMEKGISLAIDSLKFLSINYKLYIVGGEKRDITYYKEYSSRLDLSDRIIFTGNVPHNEVSLHMAACDVLIAPYPNTVHYSHYMSPMKLFEYMAGKRPIVATNLSSIREIVKDQKTALLVPPDDSRALGEAIEKFVVDKTFGEAISEAAYREVEENYTWDKRAEKIIQYIQS